MEAQGFCFLGQMEQQAQGQELALGSTGDRWILMSRGLPLGERGWVWWDRHVGQVMVRS
jgi:hypothetical protein